MMSLNTILTTPCWFKFEINAVQAYDLFNFVYELFKPDWSLKDYNEKTDKSIRYPLFEELIYALF